MPSSAIIEHQLPGRLRLRIPTRRGDVSFFQGLVHALSERPDVKEIDATPLNRERPHPAFGFRAGDHRGGSGTKDF
jgi:hypothetical protein